jgi:hypothetical protein
MKLDLDLALNTEQLRNIIKILLAKIARMSKKRK